MVLYPRPLSRGTATGGSATDRTHGTKEDSEKHSTKHARRRQGPERRDSDEDEQGQRHGDDQPTAPSHWNAVDTDSRMDSHSAPLSGDGGHATKTRQGAITMRARAHSFPECAADLIHGSVDRAEQVTVGDVGHERPTGWPHFGLDAA